MVKDRTADALFTTITEERMSYSEASDPIIEVNFKIYSRADHPKLDELRQISSLEDLHPFRLVDYYGSGWAEVNLVNAGLDVYWLNRNEQLWQFLILGRADATVKNEWTTRYILKNLDLQNKIFEMPNTMTPEPTTFHILISKKSPFRSKIEQINLAIEVMKGDGTLQRIFNQYK